MENPNPLLRPSGRGLKWKVGDFVRFAHVPAGGPSFKVLAIIHRPNGDEMVEIEGMTGQFDSQIFVIGEGNHGDASH